MKIILFLVTIVIILFVGPIVTLAQGPIYLSTPYNTNFTSGATVTYPTCMYVGHIKAYLNNGGTSVNPSTPTSFPPGGWSATIPGGSNEIDYTINSSGGGQNGDLVQPFTYPNGGGGSYTLHFVNPTAPVVTYTSQPALGSYQTGTFTFSTNKPYTYVYYRVLGRLTIQSSNNSSITISTSQGGGFLSTSVDNGNMCIRPENIILIGPPYIDGQYFNGVSCGTNITTSNASGDCSINTANSASTCTWSKIGGTGNYTVNGSNPFICTVVPTNYIRMSVQTTNPFGNGESAVFMVTRQGYSAYSMAYPNPTNDQITVTFDDADYTDYMLNELALYNSDSQLVRQFDVSAAKEKKYFHSNKLVTFDIKNLKKGSYFLHIKMGDKVDAQRVIVQ